MSESLADLIGELGNGVHDVADGINEEIAALVHSAAVGMLNSVLPPMVHGKNAVTRASGWIPLEAGTLEIGARLAGVSLGNTVLAGQVAKKIDEGVGRITPHLDYSHGANSIT